MSSQVSSTRKLVSASAIMAAGTLVSRALGLVRVMLIAFILGNGTRQAGILSLATTVPNSLYILFAGGALNTVLVPQIVRAIRNDDDGGEAYTNRIMTAFMLIVTAVAAVMTLAAPFITAIYSSNEWRSPELADQYAAMVTLTYLTLPQIFFYGAFFLLGQVLNARDRFGPMMWAPIANNVISVAVLGLYLAVWGNQGDHSQAFTWPQLLLLGLGSTVGIACQSLVLLPYLKRVGFSLRPRFDLKGTGLGRTFSLTKWTIGFVAVSQITLVIVTRLATTASASGNGGGIDVYNNAHLVWILPHSLITVSLTTAMLPNASRLAAAGDLGAVAQEATKTMRLALIALVPAAIGFFALAGPIANLLFGHGQGRAGAGWVAWALMAFAVGLIPFTIQFVCLRTYYALENTRTPFFLQLLIAAANAILALLLVWLVRSPGLVAAALALSYSLAYLIGVFISWQPLRRRLPDLDGRAISMHIVRLVLGAGLGGVGAYYLAGLILHLVPNALLANALAIVAGLAVIGGCYLSVGRLLKVRELRNLSELRLRGSRNAPNAEDRGRDDAAFMPPAADATAEDLVATRVTPVDEALVETAVNPRVQLDPHLWREAPDFGDEHPEPRMPAVAPLRAAVAETDDGDEPTRSDLGAHPPQPRVGREGMLLSTRFRLDDPLTVRNGIETWRAHDLVLSRDVAAHVLADGDHRIEGILDAARKGAVATDSRFLRVLDAVGLDEATDGVGAYVICEYVPGKSLTDLLAHGPFSALESAWLVRQLADALSSVHAHGLFHEAINPDNVMVTNTGAVRLVGFGVESAIVASEGGPQSWSAREASDVKGLGALLYATLVARWPFGRGYGLAAAPLVGDEPAGPHTVRAGVSPALDRVARAILNDTSSDTRITTVAQLAATIADVLGTADAASDLEYRVRHSAVATTPPIEDQSLGNFDVASAPRPEPPHDEEQAQHDLVHRQQTASLSQDPLGATALHPARRRSRPALWLVAALAVGTLVVSLVMVVVNGGGEQTAPPPAASSPPQPTSQQEPSQGIQIVTASSFDPVKDGGSGDENPADVGKAFDGDPATGWATMRYKNNPRMGGQKMGVGLVLDLGEERLVTAVDVTFATPGTTVELRVPAAPAATAPTTSQNQWKPVASQADAPQTTSLTPEAAVRSRYVMVYVTKLPQTEKGRYLTQINEVAVR